MPDFSEACRDRGPEQPLPEGQTRQRCKIEPDAQVRQAEGKGGIEPAAAELQTDQQLAQQAPPGRLHRVYPGPQQHPRQKAADKTAGSDGRGQKRRLRLGRASS